MYEVKFFCYVIAEMGYTFLYGGEANIDRIMRWIGEKIDATVAKNRGVNSRAIHALEDLNLRDTDMYPDYFSLYSTDVEASVHFNLDKATGEITVSFDSEMFGTKGGNPWWCLAVPRPDSRTCSKIATADAPYNISILEYIQQNILVRTSPMRTKTKTNRRKTIRSGSSGSGSSGSSSSSRRKSRNR